MSRSILIVEDEPQIARLVRMHLEELHCSVSVAGSVGEAMESIRDACFDLVILDLMLPDGDGLDVCRALRQRSDYTPILVLTARGEEVDRVIGLELGADDYLTKPFGIRELLARVKALFRRSERMASGAREPAQPPIRIRELSIEPDKRRVTRGGQPVRLTPKEFDLLVCFARNPGRVYTRTELLERVWGYGASGYEHTVNSHINRLRSKIEADPAHPRYIQTVWGVGYRFFDPAAVES
jgi:DNA-binding response OmpR family regulator